MAVKCEFIDFIIPISNIDRVYPGGFLQFKEDNVELFSMRMWHDEFLLRDGAMNFNDIGSLVKMWEGYGLVGLIQENGVKKFSDYCIVESLFGGVTSPCDWIEFDLIKKCVHLKGESQGKIVGHSNG